MYHTKYVNRITQLISNSQTVDNYKNNKIFKSSRCLSVSIAVYSKRLNEWFVS